MITSKRFTGVQLNHLKNGTDITYYINYFDTDLKKNVQLKVGKRSEGINEVFCKNMRSDILNKIRLGDKSVSQFRKTNPITLDTHASTYFQHLRDKEASEKSTKNEENRYKNHLNKPLGSKSLAKITTDDVNALTKNKRSAGLSNATIKHIHALLSVIISYSIKSGGYTGYNIMQSININKVKIDNARERFLSAPEVKTLLSDKEIVGNPLLSTFCKFALSSGSRLSTLLSIRRKDINSDTGILTLKDEKNGSTYSGFIAKNLFNNDITFLDKLKPNDFVISTNGLKTGQTVIQKPLRSILNRLFNENLDSNDRKNRVVIHSLRHTFASLLAINGTPIYTIQILLNHAQVTTSQRYAKLAPDSGSNFVQALYI
ncbi:tyrosine-type recombinase/integrase [Candidatus Sulfurimonas baltica]|uniref:Site-specific integrase n=1 Tax=Candidatus Sulfurimonas baltica TaxID=2740404 RepID=A0A7S7LX46_9BACT|nr:site-specific integrase [Candidatus Sulfurimonas baltica]QOY53042.1 site-specific integrase [Candidatus Sulfurimonas baltica]